MTDVIFLPWLIVSTFNSPGGFAQDQLIRLELDELASYSPPFGVWNLLSIFIISSCWLPKRNSKFTFVTQDRRRGFPIRRFDGSSRGMIQPDLWEDLPFWNHRLWCRQNPCPLPTRCAIGPSQTWGDWILKSGLSPDVLGARVFNTPPRLDPLLCIHLRVFGTKIQEVVRGRREDGGGRQHSLQLVLTVLGTNCLFKQFDLLKEENRNLQRS